MILLLLATAAYGSLCLWFYAHQQEFQFGDNRRPRVSRNRWGSPGLP